MELSLESIKKRVSVRGYADSPLSAEEKKALEAAFAEAGPGPFGRSPRFALSTREDAGLGGGKIGTYGVVSGASSFVIGSVEKGEFACVDFGYALEGVILRATELGLGTCWIGGVFDRGKMLRYLGAPRGEFAPAITPIGRAASEQSARDQLIRRGAGSDGRKPEAELFFEAGPGGAWLPLGDKGAWAGVLEAVRLGPSASNKQPWRLVLDRREGERLHLAMEEDRFYNNMLGSTKLQELDMGIAMRHAEVAARAAGGAGAWKRLPASPVAEAGARRYIASWIPA
jgi:nitroreductase